MTKYENNGQSFEIDRESLVGLLDMVRMMSGMVGGSALPDSSGAGAIDAASKVLDMMGAASRVELLIDHVPAIAIDVKG